MTAWDIASTVFPFCFSETMSRFFHAGSDSESESDSSVEELQPQRPVAGRYVYWTVSHTC